MTFLEKSAWVMITALLISGGLYSAGVIAMTNTLGEIPPPNIGLIAVFTIAIVALAIVGHIIAALTNLSDADAPEDERDRLVALRAGNISGILLAASVMIGISAYAVLGSGHLLFHMMVAGLVLAQVCEYALTIWYYRRGG